VIAQFTDLFRSFDDEYFAGRAVDIFDLGRRLISHLGGAPIWIELSHLEPQSILVAQDLTPLELTLLPLDRVQGIALAHSTPTAHSAILAHSLGIPMVCTLGADILAAPPGTCAVVDGKSGLVLLDPTDAELQTYTLRRTGLDTARREARIHAHASAVTRDGLLIPVWANANSPVDVQQATAAGADGVGLLRTEYLFLDRAEPPPIEEQAATYLAFAAQISGPLVIRALDAGGDKPVSYIESKAEDNPFLGLRGIRLLLKQPSLLVDQYRALLHADQAAPNADFRFLLPMISTVEEVIAVLELLREARAHPPLLPIGAMIEVPSAALTAHAIAPLVDFLSIGTNDLAQYTLASDRTNSAVARLADPFHPAVLHLIRAACLAGQAHSKPVAVCGEIAGDPLATPLLLGLGVTELSAPLPDIAQIKEQVRRQTVGTCRQLALAALACSTGAEVRELLARFHA
jgi:phosphocarrier protein FPr